MRFPLIPDLHLEAAGIEGRFGGQAGGATPQHVAGGQRAGGGVEDVVGPGVAPREAAHERLDAGEAWSRRVRELTGKRGVDICADSIGKVVHTSCIKSLARGGVFVTCGTTTGPDAVTDLARMFWLQLTLVGSTMGDMDEFRQAIALLRSGALQPVVDRVFDASEAPQAFERLESGAQFGKIVLQW